ncbi:MAG: glycosyltransferase [Butyrivibrio sp.]|nr:glycosyltransferase [Butyrivibrio sp.]
MTRPLITVIVPAYNSPDIRASIDSVLIQKYPNIQLIVLDDASDNFDKDEVERYIRANAGNNFSELIVIQNPENIGTVKNMNQGFRMARGEYIFNLAGDDVFYDSKVLDDWVTEFESTGAEILTAKREVYDETLTELYGVEPKAKQIELIKNLDPLDLFEELCSYNFIFGCCTAYSKDLIKGDSFFDETYRVIEDYPFFLRASRLRIKIFYFDRVVVKYRSGGASSPKHYSTIYKKDSNRIFTFEVMPYTKHKFQAFLMYREWSKGQERGLYETISKTDYIHLYFFKAWYALKYPEEISHYFMRHSKKKHSEGGKVCR